MRYQNAEMKTAAERNLNLKKKKIPARLVQINSRGWQHTLGATGMAKCVSVCVCTNKTELFRDKLGLAE